MMQIIHDMLNENFLLHPQSQKYLSKNIRKRDTKKTYRKYS